MRPQRGSAESLDEPVELSDWDPCWLAQAQALVGQLTMIVGPDGCIEHIGSTAVEGMRAKPVLDLMIGVSNPIDVDNLARQLAGMGWRDMGEAGVPGRRYLRQRSGNAVNLHIAGLSSLHWMNNLALRDFLRAHPDERALYSALKDAVVADGAARLLAYSDQKAPFMAALLARAMAWWKLGPGDRLPPPMDV